MVKLNQPGYSIPIYNWCDDVDEGAMKQAKELAAHPRTWKHVALMPDCHKGYGMPIGGVIAVSDAVIPNAVGIDIGCGMIASKSEIRVEEISQQMIKKTFGILRDLVPVGFKHHNKDQKWEGFDECPTIDLVYNELKSARRQMGTLGGGNHFIEIQAGSDGFVWFMIHSGSRNFGYKIAKHYNDLAQRLCERWHSVVCPFVGEDGLAFLPIDTCYATEYIEAMKYALEFALENRKQMMLNFKCAINYARSTGFEQSINIHHNYAAIENHFGRNVWIHRKGATMAAEGQLGIIPGSMGTASYIVKGKGNRDSFRSCSHGAGRLMGSAEFSRTHTVEECDKAMEGIVFGRWGKDRKGNIKLSEAPQAYKDIEHVMKSQADLVDIVVKLKPLGVMKG